MKLKAINTCCFLLLSTFIFSQNPWKGTLVHTFSDKVNSFSFTTKTDKTLINEGRDPFVLSTGEIVFMNERFPKKGVLIRKRTSNGQLADVLDMSNDNPVYKPQLENYSVIRGTGISSILQYMDDAKISPNGKYISVTILGGYQNAFTENCVAVFSVSTQMLVKKFDNKYYGSWTPDNKLVMCGAYKRGSTNETMYISKEPGIYITDSAFNKIKRIDPSLNDPSPYHAAVSPDGKKIAYVLNDHIWIMNIDGTGNKQLTDVDKDNVETYPVFSPDSRYVACWSYKTFERSYYTAIAIVDANSKQPVALKNNAAVWPKDIRGFRISGGSKQFSWIK